MNRDEIINKKFSRAFIGYDIGQVDAFLDALADELSALTEETERLRREAEELRQRPKNEPLPPKQPEEGGCVGDAH